MDEYDQRDGFVVGDDEPLEYVDDFDSQDVDLENAHYSDDPGEVAMYVSFLFNSIMRY